MGLHEEPGALEGGRGEPSLLQAAGMASPHTESWQAPAVTSSKRRNLDCGISLKSSFTARGSGKGKNADGILFSASPSSFPKP